MNASLPPDGGVLEHFVSPTHFDPQVVEKLKAAGIRTLMLTGDTRPPHAQECVEFAQAIVEGRPSPVPPEDSLDVQTILEAVYRSQASGAEVRFD